MHQISKELDENVEYDERESEFDIEDEDKDPEPQKSKSVRDTRCFKNLCNEGSLSIEKRSVDREIGSMLP